MFKKILLITIIISSVSLLGFTVAKGQGELLVAEGVSAGSSLIGSDLLVTLLQLKSLQLKGDLFDDEAFLHLKDFGIEIQPQPTGRQNPFNSIGSDSL